MANAHMIMGQISMKIDSHLNTLSFNCSVYCVDNNTMGLYVVLSDAMMMVDASII